MSEHPLDMRKSIRTYGIVGGLLFVFTAITVGVNLVHVSSVALAITIALVIATMKGTMVAAIFMHLNHEKKWIYGALVLTVVFFTVLILLPNLTVGDTIGKTSSYALAAEQAAQKAEKAGKAEK